GAGIGGPSGRRVRGAAVSRECGLPQETPGRQLKSGELKTSRRELCLRLFLRSWLSLLYLSPLRLSRLGPKGPGTPVKGLSRALQEPCFEPSFGLTVYWAGRRIPSKMNKVAKASA